jgi:hypothetical protein
MNAALFSRSKDLLEEERAEAESLPGIRHDETDVGWPFVGRAYRATPTSSGSCPSSTSATTAIRR